MKTFEFQKNLKPGDVLSIKKEWFFIGGWYSENNKFGMISNLNLDDLFIFVGYEKCINCLTSNLGNSSYCSYLCKKCKGHYIVEHMKSKKRYHRCGNFNNGVPMFEKAIVFEEFITEEEFSV